MKGITWTVKDIVDILKARQDNEFDGNVAVTGDRGNGKSTLILKTVYRVEGFDPWKHQVYNREDIIKLLRDQTKSVCWDDEAINSGYKRNFQDKAQQELIKFLTAYRDNYNLYFSAIPNFFSLDKDLRDLFFLHLHIIERGIAVVHMPLQGRLYSQDRWDAKFNSKVESKWGEAISKNPEYRIPYHRLTTFRGYLFFEDVTPKQKELYKLIKKTKRAESFILTEDKKEKSPIEKIYERLLTKQLSKDTLIQMCLMEKLEYTNVTRKINEMLKNSGNKESVTDFLLDEIKKKKPNLALSDLKASMPNF